MTTIELTASRETDKLVAECLGWREVKPAAQNGPVDLVGIPPGQEKPVPVPFFSSSTAALLALEDWQRATGNEVVVTIGPDSDDVRFMVEDVTTSGQSFCAPTLWLALCKLMTSCSTNGKESP